MVYRTLVDVHKSVCVGRKLGELKKKKQQGRTETRPYAEKILIIMNASNVHDKKSKMGNLHLNQRSGVFQPAEREREGREQKGPLPSLRPPAAVRESISFWPPLLLEEAAEGVAALASLLASVGVVLLLFSALLEFLLSEVARNGTADGSKEAVVGLGSEETTCGTAGQGTSDSTLTVSSTVWTFLGVSIERTAC